MQIRVEKKEIARQLQAKIDAMQGLGRSREAQVKTGLSPFDSAFPGRVFPIGALHEFISYEPANAASTSGFITALASRFMKEGGICLWIGTGRKIFPASLKQFGLEPDGVVFIDAPTAKNALWTIEEALKCEALCAVVGEVRELGFTESRRLQLTVEHSGVTAFIHRYSPLAENAIACTTRWKVSALPSVSDADLPGVGHACWDVQLLKVRNGRPDSWQVSWSGKEFVPIAVQQTAMSSLTKRNAG